MNKVFKVIALMGNASEIVIASAMVADLISKLRGGRKATISITEAEGVPEPDQPMAA